MSKRLKTTWTGASVHEFIETVASETKKKDAYALLKRFEDVTQFTAKMWGPYIIGFGKYSYTYASGHSREAPIVGFSPRKANISLYVGMDEERRNTLLAQLGKHKSSKACVYINKLADINIEILDELIEETVKHVTNTYDVIDD